MFDIIYCKAAENVAGEPVSVEADGSVWADSDGRVIDTALISSEYARLVAEQEGARASAISRFKKLGFTDDEIATLVLP